MNSEVSSKDLSKQVRQKGRCTVDWQFWAHVADEIERMQGRIDVLSDDLHKRSTVEPGVEPVDAGDIDALDNLAALQADGERYRWLRVNGVHVIDEFLTGPDLDAAVDAERSALTKGGEHG